jgi:hypothetical protein
VKSKTPLCRSRTTRDNSNPSHTDGGGGIITQKIVHNTTAQKTIPANRFAHRHIAIAAIFLSKIQNGKPSNTQHQRKILYPSGLATKLAQHAI